MRGGAPDAILAHDEWVQADEIVHFLTVKVRIDDAQRDLNFLVDTGAITVIDEETARGLVFKDSVTNKVVDASGNKKDVALVQVGKLSVGNVAVRDCAAAIVDLKKLSPKIDGILGSNFLRHFVVQIDYRNKNLKFLAKAEPDADELTGSMKIPMWQDMRFGFAPTLKCEIDNTVTADCMVDTGHVAVASFPLSIVEKLPHFKSGEYLRSNGVMGAGVFGKDKESYLVKTDRITSGPITIDNAAVVTNNFENVMTLGAGYLQNFLVTIDYPGSLLYLRAYGDRQPELAFPSHGYGFGVAKEQGKTLVSGVWRGCAADKAGLAVGDEVLFLDGKEAAGMSFLDIMQLMRSTESITVTYSSKTNKGASELKLRKENLTHLFQSLPN